MPGSLWCTGKAGEKGKLAWKGTLSRPAHKNRKPHKSLLVSDRVSDMRVGTAASEECLWCGRVGSGRQIPRLKPFL